MFNSLYRLYNLIACDKNLKEMQKLIQKLRTTRVYKNLSYTLCTKNTIIKVCQIDYLLNLKNESAISGGSVMGNSNMIEPLSEITDSTVTLTLRSVHNTFSSVFVTVVYIYIIHMT
jgi:hypothetical protein